MKKKKLNTGPSKAYKTILSRIYIMIIIVLVSVGVGYYILRVTNSLNEIYKEDETTSSKSVSIPTVDQSIKAEFDSRHDSSDASAEKLPNIRTNPFN